MTFIVRKAEPKIDRKSPALLTLVYSIHVVSSIRLRKKKSFQRTLNGSRYNFDQADYDEIMCITYGLLYFNDGADMCEDRCINSYAVCVWERYIHFVTR